MEFTNEAKFLHVPHLFCSQNMTQITISTESWSFASCFGDILPMSPHRNSASLALWPLHNLTHLLLHLFSICIACSSFESGTSVNSNKNQELWFFLQILLFIISINIKFSSPFTKSKKWHQFLYFEVILWAGTSAAYKRDGTKHQELWTICSNPTLFILPFAKWKVT